MQVCVDVDFIGLLAVPRVLHQAEFPLHLLFSVCKGTFLAFDVESFWSEQLVFFGQSTFITLVEPVQISANY